METSLAGIKHDSKGLIVSRVNHNSRDIIFLRPVTVSVMEDSDVEVEVYDSTMSYKFDVANAKPDTMNAPKKPSGLRRSMTAVKRTVVCTRVYGSPPQVEIVHCHCW